MFLIKWQPGITFEQSVKFYFGDTSNKIKWSWVNAEKNFTQVQFDRMTKREKEINKKVHKVGKEDNFPILNTVWKSLLTILAAGPVEPSRAVTEVGGSLSTPATIEAHAIAAHRCVCTRGQAGSVTKKTGKKLASEAETPGSHPKMSTSAVSSTDLFLSEPYRPVNSCIKRNFEAPPFALTNVRGIQQALFEQTSRLWAKLKKCQCQCECQQQVV